MLNLVRNAADQNFNVRIVDRTDGTPVTTGTVTGQVMKDGVTFANMAGTVAHSSEGSWKVSPTAADVDAEDGTFKFIHSANGLSVDVNFETRINTTLAKFVFTTGAVNAHVMSFNSTAENDLIKKIWDYLTSALTLAGSVGKLIVDNLNAAVASRSSHSAGDVWTVGTREVTNAQVIGPGAISPLSFQVNAITNGAIADGAITPPKATVIGDQSVDGTVVAGTLGPTEFTTDLNITVDGQYQDRTVIFKDDTTTVALRGTPADVTSTKASDNSLSLGKALPASPVAGDTFRLI